MQTQRKECFLCDTPANIIGLICIHYIGAKAQCKVVHCLYFTVTESHIRFQSTNKKVDIAGPKSKRGLLFVSQISSVTSYLWIRVKLRLLM
jgi:hypothetical protein